MSIFIVNQCNHDPERKICSECQKINKINELETQQRTTRKLLKHAEDRIAELEAQLEAIRKRVLNCQQYTTNSAMVHDGRFMEVVAIKAAINGDKP